MTTTAAHRRRQQEQRRLQAAELFAQGARQADVAGTLGAPRSPAASRKPRLTPAQRKTVQHALELGPTAHGFDTDQWTLKRVAQVIQRATGEQYPHRAGSGSSQAAGLELAGPARRASGRDQQQIAGWVAQHRPRSKQPPNDAEPGAASLDQSVDAHVIRLWRR